MANPKTKPELLEAMANDYAKLKELIVKMSQEKAEQPFKFTFDPKKCGTLEIRPMSARFIDAHLRIPGIDADLCAEHPRRAAERLSS